jgi:hypothetical protein
LRALPGKICDTSEKLDNFNVSFPATACPHTFHITKVLLYDLKKVAINEFGILNIKPCMCQISGLDPSNCLGIRAFADTHACRDLLRIADKFTQHNFQEVRYMFNMYFINLHDHSTYKLCKGVLGMVLLGNF